MEVDAWLARAAARGTRARRARGRRATLTYAAAARARRAPARPRCRRGRRARATASRSRCRRRGLRAWRCTRACCSAPSRCPSTCAWRAESAQRSPRAPRARRRRAARAAPAAAGAPRAPRSRRAPRSSSTPRARPRRREPVELTYGNWLWSALGSAVALGLDPGERWLCALPLVARRRASRSWSARAIYGHDGGRARALRHRPRARALARRAASRSSRSSPTTLARLLDAGPRAPAGAALGAARRRARVPPRCSSARAAAGVPVALAYGLTEAAPGHALPGGARPADRRRRRSSAPGWRSPPTARSSSPGRPSPPPRAGARLAAHRRPRRVLDERGGCRSSGARPTRSSPAARTSPRRRLTGSMAPSRPLHPSLAQRALCRQNPSQEPSALDAHAGICAGGRRNGRSLPR